MLKLLLMAAGVAAIAGAGAAGGAKVRGMMDDHVIAVCADGIAHSNLNKACPGPIVAAFAALAAPAMAKEIEYRDKTVPLIVDSGVQARAENDQLRADLAAIQSEPKTNACAATPAFVELRRQLCAQAAGAAGPECAADPATH